VQICSCLPFRVVLSKSWIDRILLLHHFLCLTVPDCLFCVFSIVWSFFLQTCSASFRCAVGFRCLFGSSCCFIHVGFRCLFGFQCLFLQVGGIVNHRIVSHRKVFDVFLVFNVCVGNYYYHYYSSKSQLTLKFVFASIMDCCTTIVGHPSRWNSRSQPTPHMQ